MCYCPTPTLHLNLALTGDGAFLFSLKKTHSVWFISVLKSEDMGKYPHKSPSPCNTGQIQMYFLICHKSTHARTHTHTHSLTHSHTHTRAFLKVTELTLTHLEISPMCPDKRPLLCCVCRARAPCWPECVYVCVCVRECMIPAADLRSDCVEFWWSDTATEGASTNHTLFDIISDNCASVQTSVVSDWSLIVHLISLLIT